MGIPEISMNLLKVSLTLAVLAASIPLAGLFLPSEAPQEPQGEVRRTARAKWTMGLLGLSALSAASAVVAWIWS